MVWRKIPKKVDRESPLGDRTAFQIARQAGGGTLEVRIEHVEVRFQRRPEGRAPDFTRALEEFLEAPEDRRRRLLDSLPIELRAEVERLAGLEGTVSPGFLHSVEQSSIEAADSLPAAIDRYEPEQRLARTAFSQVFLARDLVSRRRVALKLLPPFGAEDDRMRKFFFREIRALQKLEHPNVVVIHGSGESAEGPYIVTELLRGPQPRRLAGR